VRISTRPRPYRPAPRSPIHTSTSGRQEPVSQTISPP
jgi:hypothetical protein